MDAVHYKEMSENLALLFEENILSGCDIYLFGYCNATEELADLLMARGCRVQGILDNSISKQGLMYKAIPIVPPVEVLKKNSSHTVVCIASRFFAAMKKQLESMGYNGQIQNLVEYDSYADYSLSRETLGQKRKRVERGILLLEQQKKKYPEFYRIYCPFSALGDVYYTMAYLPYFLERKSIRKYVIFTVGCSCREVARMFGAEYVETLSQGEMDETVQAVLRVNDAEAYISHHDCPYVIQLTNAFYVKKISLEMIYKCGVFGLEGSIMPYQPIRLKKYKFLDKIKPGQAVILSPYAKSIVNVPREYWKKIVNYYKKRGWQVFTNVAGEEVELEGTIRLETELSELQSVVERAGTFIGIRSGLCDVLRKAACRKIALYPNCYYSDTVWKLEDIFRLDDFENIVI